VARDVPVFLERHGKLLTDAELAHFQPLRWAAPASPCCRAQARRPPTRRPWHAAAPALERHGCRVLRCPPARAEPGAGARPPRRADYEVNHYLLIAERGRAALDPAPGRPSAAAKNRRLARLQQLLQNGEFFSMDAMRQRAPLLYEQVSGRAGGAAAAAAAAAAELRSCCRAGPGPGPCHRPGRRARRASCTSAAAAAARPAVHRAARAAGEEGPSGALLPGGCAGGTGRGALPQVALVDVCM
jgi:hypothetical protein